MFIRRLLTKLNPMKHFFIFFLISFSVFSQDFSKIKAKTDTYYTIRNAKDLAERINSDFSSEEEKVKALFCWITDKIKYDLKEFYNPNRETQTRFRYRTLEERDKILEEIKDKLVTKTLSSRKGVCEGYAQTFAKVCNLLGIENEIIKGYVRTNYRDINRPVSLPNHAWNAVKINNKWMYIDTTWASGFVINGQWEKKFIPYFYNIPVKTYFKTHYPEKSIWKLRVGRMEKNDFYNQPIHTYAFLTSDVELTSPLSGVLRKNRDGKIEIQLQNVQPTQSIHVGFLGDPMAKTPIISTKNGITTVSTQVPKNTNQLFLMIDGIVVLEFLVR